MEVSAIVSNTTHPNLIILGLHPRTQNRRVPGINKKRVPRPLGSCFAYDI